MPDPEERRIIEFEKLNWLGKTVFLAGAAVETTAQLIDKALEKAVDLVLETERAFKEGRDSPVDDAKVLEDWEREGEGERARGGKGEI